VFYKFHQDPDFFYLTGMDQTALPPPSSSLHLHHRVPRTRSISYYRYDRITQPSRTATNPYIGKSEDGTDHTFHLYVREKDSKAEIWDGARSGTQAAMDVFNADETGDISKLKSILPPIIIEASQVYTDITKPDANTSTILRFLHGPSQKTEGFSGMIEAKKIRSLRPVINDLRVYKSAAEIANMRRAGQASGRAHTEVMKHNWSHEKELDGFLEYQFKKNGCESIAFEPVVAGAENALSIHYVRNDDVLHNGQMVLVDGGGTYGGYIADITRCWPVNGKFSDPQRDLYEAVLKVQQSCIALCRESANVSLDKLHEIAENGLKDQLEQIGFDMSGKAIETLFPHHLGHYIGLDVHDSVGYSRKVVLSKGHCITIEPGVYIPVDEKWPKHFQGMGIRIEDSICVQADNPYVLTTEAVKEVVDIENLRD
jgi:intermediate cleaving peptidase 55